MRWFMPPQNRGQIVEVSYATDCAGAVFRRTYDRVDRTETIEIADASDCGCQVECDCFSPWREDFDDIMYDWRQWGTTDGEVRS